MNANKTKALLYIVLPILSYMLMTLIGGTVAVIAIFLYPLFVVIVCYGVLILFNGRRSNTESGTSARGWGPGAVMLSVGLALHAWVQYTLYDIRQETGYGGSEANIAALPFLPFMFWATILVVIGLVKLIKYYTSYRKNR